jgi:hypothetical protein
VLPYDRDLVARRLLDRVRYIIGFDNYFAGSREEIFPVDTV